jgi:delta(3,5)-delta(2,4)-dienoyl-CoA isomerase
MPYGPYETLRVTGPDDGVLHVELNRPDQLNAMNKAFWRECRECFRDIASDTDTRVVVLSANGKAFSAGLDLTDIDAQEIMGSDKKDAGRTAFRVRRMVLEMQDSFNAIEAVPVPVIVAVHGAVIGGGIDLLCACCIRNASKDAKFSIKEVDVGLAADIGTLQRLPKICGNEGMVRELAYTARNFYAEEAQKMGFVTRVFENKDEALKGSMELAQELAAKSPLAIVGTKRMITYTRDHSIQDGLDYVATWNGSALQAPDMMIAAQAMFQKKKGTFSKL